MIVGCYVTHLYCDVDSCDYGKDEFTGETGGETRRLARDRGWLIGDRDLCPWHSGKTPKPRKPEATITATEVLAQ